MGHFRPSRGEWNILQNLDGNLLARVKRAYRLALVKHGDAGSVWSPIDARRADIHAALLSNTDHELHAVFEDPLSTDLYYGVDDLCRTIRGAHLEEEQVRKRLNSDMRILFSYVAGRLGIIDDIERVLTTFDSLLHQRVNFPTPFRGEWGIPTTRGLASYRALAALYQTSRLISLVPKGKSVVEIGPGMGRTAYYAYRAGLTDYTTIDLPLGVVAQACFLGATLGPEKIWLEGDDEQLAEQRIKLLTAKPARGFDIALNVDSLPEMSPSITADYIGWIARHAKSFLSINHERNAHNVADIARVVLKFDRKVRSQYPINPIYFEDAFMGIKPRLFGVQAFNARSSFQRGSRAMIRRMISFVPRVH